MTSSPLSPQQAAQELLSRRQARKSLLRFTEYTNPAYRVAEHHRQIIAKLEAVERGEIGRLMLFLPPRHGKSELASRRFPAWYLGRNPVRQIITASYGDDLASEFGRDVRNIVASPEYAALFEVALRPDSRSAQRWHTAQGGQYVSAGVGAGITGRGADLALIDDPVKDRQDADSATMRDKVWNWYRSTLYTRLMPGAAIVLIQTRWHEDDLAGRILRESEEAWDVVELPALKEGAALWPEWFPVPRLEQIRQAVGPREFSALYQQKPQPDEGTFFKRDWFKWYKQAPSHAHHYLTSDFAVTDDGGDFTVLGCHAVDSSDDLYAAVGYWRGQTSADVWIEQLCDLIIGFKPLAAFGESGPIRRSIEPFLTKRMRERKAYCRVEWIPSVADKPARARALQARASMGKVLLPDSEIGHALLAQLLAFPAGLHDDDVDMLGLMGRVIDQAHPAMVPRVEQKVPRDGYGQVQEVDSWKVA